LSRNSERIASGHFDADAEAKRNPERKPNQVAGAGPWQNISVSHADEAEEKADETRRSEQFRSDASAKRNRAAEDDRQNLERGPYLPPEKMFRATGTHHRGFSSFQGNCCGDRAGLPRALL